MEEFDQLSRDWFVPLGSPLPATVDLESVQFSLTSEYDKELRVVYKQSLNDMAGRILQLASFSCSPDFDQCPV